ncbi:hypothetical protein [Ichthyenterobacterium magnum]|uniref:Uncharacterized protein n=1 Tax=Ichthyenterobacterium magnum TaxID=1230530 RepID=A0A420DFM3_9FLAO|nr:hypothetical protein [Ichthyenterobacterium magnum]RKE91906.1 hypothetical protein BXY80_2335 [Ichthyenterobacterium magnum]
MATQTPQPVTHVYKEINAGKYKSVKHYELQRTLNGTPLLSHLLNVSKDRMCAKSSPLFWVQTHNGKKWVKPRLTGLFKTPYKDTYKGDAMDKKHLIIVKFFDNYDYMIVYYFKDYYTKDLHSVLSLVNASIKETSTLTNQ